MKNKVFAAIVLSIALLVMTGCSANKGVTPEEAKEIAREAYIYGFPMIMNYKTMYMSTLNEESPEYKGPFNVLGCAARLYTPEDKTVVTPNSDTPYCMAWIDIRNEPAVISLPEMEADRFYHFQLIDLYTHNFAYLGTLTTGNSAGIYMIAGQNWDGEIPEDITEVIHSETDIFFIVVRTQLMHDQDLENVKRIQSEYGLQGLNAWLGKEAPQAEPLPDFPEWNEGDQFTREALVYMDAMLQLIRPVAEEQEMMDRFARLGLGTEDAFDIMNFDEDIQNAIDEGVQEGFEAIEQFVKESTHDPLFSAKIFGTREFLRSSAMKNYQLDDFYLLRAAAAHLGLYGNSGSEAMYPTYLRDSEGSPYDASSSKYTITFPEGQLPPVKAFWSLTMYDGTTQLLVNNPLKRYLLNSLMMDHFVFGNDGSLTLYIQKDSPGTALENNWLPAPDGPFYAVLRLYGPTDAALMGEWVNPPLLKQEQ